jgi:hypothetical protein
MTSTTSADDRVPMPPHLRRAVAGLDGLIARAEAAKARWAAAGEAVSDRRSVALAALADEWLAQLRASRAAVLADGGRRRSTAIAGEAPPVVDDALP